MRTFTQSGVVFTDNPHGYHKDGIEYSGITSLIHAVKRLGVYPAASDYVKTYTIPKAGAYGTSVHKAIEFYDSTGIKNTKWSSRFGMNDVESELNSYIRLKREGGYENVLNEFNVAFGAYSSNIDNIWMKGDDIYLVDTKTNNLDYYPNGEEGLKEYLLWQLNCYRVMFEKQTGVEVKGLLANWLRKDKGETWEIPMIDDESVIELLDTPCEPNPNWSQDNDEPRFLYYSVVDGEKVYYTEETEVVSVSSDLAVANDVVEYMHFLDSQMAHYQYELNKLKDGLMKAMSEKGVKSWDCGGMKATIVPESESRSFDKDRFFEVHKELADEVKKYTKTSKRKASIRITFRD